MQCIRRSPPSFREFSELVLVIAPARSRIRMKGSRLKSDCLITRVFARAIVLLIAFPAFPHAAGAANESGWQELLFKAEEVTMQGHRTVEMRRRGQDSAIVLAKRALEEAQQGGAAFTAQIKILAVLGNYYYRNGDTAQAEMIWRTALDSLDHMANAAPQEAELLLHRLGILCADAEAAGDSATPDRCDPRARSFRWQVWESLAPETPRQLLDLAEIYARLERNDDMTHVCERLVEVDEKLASGNPWYAVRALIFQAEGISKSLDFVAQNSSMAQDSAVRLGERALALACTRADSMDTSIAFAATRLGDYDSRLGNADRAADLWDRAWRINRRVLPPEHIENQGSIFRMASVMRATGRYAEAEDLYNLAVSLSEKMYGHGHPETAYKYAALASLFRLTGRCDDAVRCYQTALEIRRTAVQYNESEIAQILRDLGSAYSDQGRYARAEQMYLEALELRQQLLGESHGLVGELHETIANLYLTWGREGDAREVLEKALKIKRGFFGVRHPALVTTLQSLADVLSSEGRFDSAAVLLKQALGIISDQPDWQLRAKAECLLRLAGLQLENGHADRAEQLAREARGIHGQFLSPTDPRLASDFDMIARACAHQQKHRQAAQVFDSIIAFDPSLSVFSTPAIAQGYEDYAAYCLEHGRDSMALRLATGAYRIRRQHLQDAAQVMSEHDALVFAGRLRSARDLLLSAYLESRRDGTNPGDSALALILSSKDAVTDGMMERARLPRLHRDSVASSLSDSLRYVRVRLAGLYLKGPQNDRSELYDRRLAELSSTKRRLEEEVARRVGFNTESHRGTGWSGLEGANILPGDARLIEFIRFDRVSRDHGRARPSYVAGILGGTAPPKLVELDAADLIDSCVARYRAHIESVAESGAPPGPEAQRQYFEISRRLYQHVWQPIAGEVPDSAAILIAPDGELNLISFAGLLVPDGKYLIERHAVHYVTSSAEAGRSLRPEVQGSGLLALGDPDFDVAASSSDRAIDAAHASSLTRTDMLGSLRSACREIDSLKLHRLAGAREEVSRVAAFWDRGRVGPSTTLTGADASEANFKWAAPGHEVIHLATHGFFLHPECRSSNPGLQGPAAARVANDNPLLLSGICLAGANRFRQLTDSTAIEDGILTAEEVCSLDLSGTDWVVLSSCESGLGRVVTGEGIYGLRRSFLMAGARTVFSTLWQIPDWTTQELMRRLYTSDGTSVPARLQAAACATIADLRRRGQPDHPYNWAAFIAVGAWQSRN